MAEFDGYWYHHQLRNYLVQFMAVFADMYVQVGWLDDKEPRFVKVPIKNSSSDRLVADIISENTQNKPVRLPLMAASLAGVTMAPERRKGIATRRATTYIPTGGLAPNDITVVEQRMPVPYTLNFELGIWASNQDQHYQILEQIISIFDPTLQIQTDDDPLDWTRITSIELMGLSPEEQPPGVDRRIIQTTLSFDVVAYLSIPAKQHSRVVKDIFVRVGAVSQLANSSQDIVAELDRQGIDYTHWFDSSDFNLPGQD